jgi:hypothetical protein
VDGSCNVLSPGGAFVENPLKFAFLTCSWGIGEPEIGEGGGEVMEFEKELERAAGTPEVEFVLGIFNLPKKLMISCKGSRLKY